jgi:hypothetical protein
MLFATAAASPLSFSVCVSLAFIVEAEQHQAVTYSSKSHQLPKSSGHRWPRTQVNDINLI